MNKRRVIPAILILAVVILCILGVIRFQTINTYFQDNYGIQTTEFDMNEIVPFEDDLVFGESLSGYSIRVDNAEIYEFEEFIALYGAAPSEFSNPPEKVCAISATLFNENSSAPGVYLPYLMLYSTDRYTDWNSQLIALANPILSDAQLGITLAPYTEYSVTLVFNLREMHFTRYVWENLKQEDFWLLLTSAPNRKSVKLSF